MASAAANFSSAGSSARGRLPEANGREDAIRRGQALLADGLHYARSRDLKVCVGFGVTGDPTNATCRSDCTRGSRRCAAYPMLDYVWLWQSEVGLGGGSDPAPRDSQLGMMVDRYAGEFQDLDKWGQPTNARRVHEAVRMMLYARLGHAMLKRLAPGVPLVISGWGGDRHDRFSDFYVGLDRTLPDDVIFAALDNIDPTAATAVAAAYGKLTPGRRRWPIPWWESDGGGHAATSGGRSATPGLFSPLFGHDALAKKCQGMLAIHWRTRDVEEAAALECEVFAWNPQLTYEQFFDGFARAAAMGPPGQPRLAPVHRELDALGPHTGGLGQTECDGYDRNGFPWFDDGRLPKAENLVKLAALRPHRRRAAGTCSIRTSRRACRESTGC